MLVNSSYWVAEKRFWVMRSRSTEKAPVPRPLVNFSNDRAPYITRVWSWSGGWSGLVGKPASTT